MEIERKFLLKSMPDVSGALRKEIEQGYLCSGPVVRIRKSNENYILTYKSKLGLPQGFAIQNEEEEMPLTREAYEHLREKIDGKLVKKTRYVLPLPQGRKAELDIFRGQLDGLAFVEVEFESEEAAREFELPDWFGEDVSGNIAFSNAYLSEVENFVQWKERLKGGE